MMGGSHFDAKVAEEFSSYLATCWNGQFKHQYPISNHPAWRKWRKSSAGRELWSCNNLRDASEKYSWVDNTDSGTPKTLQDALQRALSSGDDKAAKTTCFDIFKWGQVSRSEKRDDATGKYKDKCRNWVETMSSKGELCKQIYRAVNLLQPECTEALSEFSSAGLLMNSSMTKVYAFADTQKKIAIYDSRVGAALGFITRNFLTNNGYDEIPPQLRFMWGDASSISGRKARTRDPSNAVYKFPKFPYGLKADFVKANLSRDTNVLLQMALSRINQSFPLVTLEEIERSLFMIGFDVRGNLAG